MIYSVQNRGNCIWRTSGQMALFCGLNSVACLTRFGVKWLRLENFDEKKMMGRNDVSNFFFFLNLKSYTNEILKYMK